MTNATRPLATDGRENGLVLGRAALAATVPIAIGAGAWLFVTQTGRGVPSPRALNVFEHLYARLEGPGIALLASVTALLLLLALQARRTGPGPATVLSRTATPRVVLLFGTAALLAAGWWGRAHVLSGTDLAMDEFASWFQARIFAEGRLRAPVPQEWRAFVRGVAPTFVAPDASGESWASTYLPVFAAARCAAQALGAEGLLNPFLTALGVPVVWLLCRRLWPGEADSAAVGALLFATTPQVVVNAMTGYAMPAHLTANLLWLLLWLTPGRFAALALPVVGGAALGLHNPFPHALFVAPFLLASLRDWSARRIAFTSGIYAVFAAGWWTWLRSVHPEAAAPEGPLALFGLPGLGQLPLQAMNLGLVVSWQSPASLLLAAVAVATLGGVQRTVRLAALGLALSFAFYLLFPASQGHGWGYRYVHGALGGWLLLSVAGYRKLRADLGGFGALRIVRAGALAAVTLALPLRLVQVRDFAAPFADGLALVKSVRSEVVVVDTASAWYARDLVRNDPFLRERPVVISLQRLTDEARAELGRRSGDGVVVLGARELSLAGLTTFAAAGPSARVPSPAR